jgi:hypothetical protein
LLSCHPPTRRTHYAFLSGRWFDVPEAAPGDRPVIAWLRTRFAGYAEPVGELLAGLTEADVQAYPHVLHRVPSQWGSGPTTLLGDASIDPLTQRHPCCSGTRPTPGTSSTPTLATTTAIARTRLEDSSLPSPKSTLRR